MHAFLFFYGKFCLDGACRACIPTFSAADTVHAVWLFPYGDIYFAGLLTSSAGNTLAFIYFVAVQGEAVEQTVNGAQGAKVAAERTVEDRGKK